MAKGKAGNPAEGTKAVLPLHELGDEPRVLQGEEVGGRHPEAANLVGVVRGRDQKEEDHQSPEVGGHHNSHTEQHPPPPPPHTHTHT